jgi:hypothetical protein
MVRIDSPAASVPQAALAGEGADLLAAAQLPALGSLAAGQPCVISGEVLVQKGL